MDDENSRETYDAYITTAQANEWNVPQRMQYLLEQWSLASPIIKGKLEQRGDIWWLTQATNPDGDSLEYPLSDFPDRRKSLQRPGVFVGSGLSMEQGQYVSASFAISSESQREKWGNPLLIKVRPETLKLLTRISLENIHHRADGSIDLDTTIFQAYVENNHADLTDRLRKSEEQITELEERAKEINAHNSDSETELASKRQLAATISQQMSEAQAQRDLILSEIEADFQDERQHREEAFKKIVKDLKLEQTLVEELHANSTLAIFASEEGAVRSCRKRRRDGRQCSMNWRQRGAGGIV